MNPSRIGIGAVVALAVVVRIVTLNDEPVVTETAPAVVRTLAKKADIATESRGESKVHWLRDGTKVYRVPVVMRDGGRDVDERGSLEAPCKRRPKGVDGALCLHATTDLSGKPTQGPSPELNRYPAAEMIGPGCEGVACSVFLGEDADAEEVKPK